MTGLLAIYLDTIIPADAVSPSASDLDIARPMLEKIGNRGFPEASLYADGLRWLQRTANRLHQTSFTELTEPQRVAVVSLAEQGEEGSIERRFFEHSRDWAMDLFYSNPRSWPALGQLHAPQPLGYYEYTRPPVN